MLTFWAKPKMWSSVDCSRGLPLLSKRLNNELTDERSKEKPCLAKLCFC